jgi:hypothetical protein
MKRLILAGSLLTLGAMVAPAADWTLPWLKTRPKPIVLNAPEATTPPPAPTKQVRVAYHGKATWTSTGRLYFPSQNTYHVNTERSKTKIWKNANN